MNPKRLLIGMILLIVLAVLAISEKILENRTVAEAAGVQAPMFEVDPLWPKPLPNHWIMGNTIGVSADAQDHIWIIHRAGSLEAMELYGVADAPAGASKRRNGVVEAECCAPAPPILEFDQAGNLLHHWGGSGQGYEWPDSNHGITIDYKGYVWIGGNGVGTDPNAPPRGAGRGAARGQAAAAPAAPAPEGQTGPAIGYTHDSMIMKFTQDGKFIMQIGKVGASKGSNDIENLRRPA